MSVPVFPYSTPILPVVVPVGEYCLVQDLRINKVVEPIHPLVINPSTILAQIPGDPT